jgi:hypothetical protein
MTEPRFFELLEHVGIDADGQPEPLVHTHVRKLVPTLVAGELRMVEQIVELKPVGKAQGDCRVTVTCDPAVADHLVTNGVWREVDPTTPVQKRLRTKLLAQEA